jgi:hypothetical protein
MPKRQSPVSRSIQNLNLAWTCRKDQQTGRTLLIQTLEDGRKQSASIPLRFDPDDYDHAIFKWAEDIKEGMLSGHSFKDAAEIRKDRQRMTGGNKFDWQSAVDKFHEALTQLGSNITQKTWDDKHAKVLANVVQIQTENPQINAQDLAIRALEQWESGSRQREVMAQALAAFLNHCQQYLGLEKEWAPPGRLSYWKGIKQLNKTSGQLAKPNKGCEIPDEWITELLDEIYEISQNGTQSNWRASARQFYKACYLMAIYGLRPIELRYLRIDPDNPEFLFCDYQKKNARGYTDPRRLYPLYPADGPTGLQIFEGFDLDAIVAPDRKVSEGVSIYLRRRSTWKRFDAELKAKGKNLVSYTFRHSYSRRGHDRGKSVPQMAVAMGHSLETHMREYPWAGSATMDDF